jgi:ABC-type branched-subunit amino acid transport system substrate-binding protein
MHKVKRKETLYSIARDFNLTEAELKAANPEMNEPGYKLRKGDFVCIPFPKPEKPKEIIPTNEELMGKKAVSAPQKLIRMGVILPFKGGSADNDKMIEFYRGVLMAVEEIKKSGTSVDVFAYDSGKSAGDIKAVVNSHPITNLDFIIGPLYPEQIAPLSKFCQQHHIKLVVPFSSLGDNVYENPYYYAINPPKSYQFAETSRLTTELFGKDNVIFLEGTENDKDAAAFIDATRKRLQQNGSKANRLKLNDDEIKWMEAMTQYKDNVIIPNSSGIKLLNQLFPKLKEFTKKNPEYRIKLVGYPEWQTYASNHLENFYQFNTYAYSSFFRNPLNGNADEFENAYQKAFHTPTLVSWPRFGMLGFDTAIYFLKGISTYGEAFDQHLSQIVTTSYQHRFDFQRISNWSGFINREVEFIHYSPSHSIELIRLKK